MSQGSCHRELQSHGEPLIAVWTALSVDALILDKWLSLGALLVGPGQAALLSTAQVQTK
jgi:hypothetical protein